MELREIIAIFKKYQKTFLYVVVGFVLIGIAAYFVQPVWYTTDLTLNVTRKGIQQTADYRYDDFYRLQADERFADTIVRWLGSPRINLDIIGDAAIAKNDMVGGVKAVRLSSQMVDVTYKTRDMFSGKKVAASLAKILDRQIEALNKDQQEDTWFKLVANEPVTSLAKISFALLFFAFLLLGIFFGAWTVMFKYYFSK